MAPLPLLFNGHAPHHSSPFFDEWWDNFPTIWNRASRACRTVVCGLDLNTSFCKHEADNVHAGSVGLTCSSSFKSSRVFAEICGAGIVLASTFERECDASYVSNAYTYFTEDLGSACVIDNIGYTGNVAPSAGTCKLDFRLLVFCLNDHYPLVSRLRILPSGFLEHLANRRAVDYDVNLVGTPERDAALVQEPSSFSGVPLEVESTSHCHIIEETLNDALCNAYPKLPQRTRKQ